MYSRYYYLVTVLKGGYPDSMDTKLPLGRD